jgi:hypothetical protein
MKRNEFNNTKNRMKETEKFKKNKKKSIEKNPNTHALCSKRFTN